MNTRLLKLPRKATALAAAVVFTLSACGTDENASGPGGATDIECAAGSVSGAGSTFVQNIVQQWIKDYSAACPDATINYQGVGSGAGIQQLTAGTVDFAGSDVPLTAREVAEADAKRGPILQVPWSAGGIAVEYNLSGVPNLRLAPSTLAGIFAGRVTRWNDGAIAADNPGVNLPDRAIQVVHRSDGSGTTAAFTAYMQATAPDVWTFGSAKDVPWPAGQGAKGSDGVTAAVKATDGAIGYAELSFAKANNLGIAAVRNAAGQFVRPDEGDSVTEALAEAEVPGNLNIEIDYTPSGEGAYPISTVTYVMVPSNLSDAAKSTLIKSFATYALEDGQTAAPRLHYAALPEAVAAPAKRAIDGIGTSAG